MNGRRRDDALETNKSDYSLSTWNNVYTGYLLWRVNGHGIVWINAGELDPLVSKLLVDFNDAFQLRLGSECVSPDLDHAEYFLLHSSWRIVSGGD